VKQKIISIIESACHARDAVTWHLFFIS